MNSKSIGQESLIDDNQIPKVVEAGTSLSDHGKFTSNNSKYQSLSTIPDNDTLKKLNSGFSTQAKTQTTLTFKPQKVQSYVKIKSSVSKRDSTTNRGNNSIFERSFSRDEKKDKDK